MKNGLVKYFAGRLGTYRYAGHYSPRNTTGSVVVINTLDNKKYSADVDVRLMAFRYFHEKWKAKKKILVDKKKKLCYY